MSIKFSGSVPGKAVSVARKALTFKLGKKRQESYSRPRSVAHKQRLPSITIFDSIRIPICIEIARKKYEAASRLCRNVFAHKSRTVHTNYYEKEPRRTSQLKREKRKKMQTQNPIKRVPVPRTN